MRPRTSSRDCTTAGEAWWISSRITPRPGSTYAPPSTSSAGPPPPVILRATSTGFGHVVKSTRTT